MEDFILVFIAIPSLEDLRLDGVKYISDIGCKVVCWINVAQNRDNAHIFCGVWQEITHILCRAASSKHIFAQCFLHKHDVYCTTRPKPLHVEEYVKCRDKETIITNIRIGSCVNQEQ